MRWGKGGKADVAVRNKETGRGAASEKRGQAGWGTWCSRRRAGARAGGIDKRMGLETSSRPVAVGVDWLWERRGNIGPIVEGFGSGMGE